MIPNARAGGAGAAARRVRSGGLPLGLGRRLAKHVCKLGARARQDQGGGEGACLGLNRPAQRPPRGGRCRAGA